jgi:ATP synthase protein I
MSDQHPSDRKSPDTPPTLESLDARLKAARQASNPAPRRRELERTAVGRAWRLTVEMVAALVVGLGIGWGLDRWLGTGPWLLLVFLLLGAATGIWNAVKTAAAIGRAAENEDRPQDD